MNGQSPPSTQPFVVSAISGGASTIPIQRISQQPPSASGPRTMTTYTLVQSGGGLTRLVSNPPTRVATAALGPGNFRILRSPQQVGNPSGQMTRFVVKKPGLVGTGMNPIRLATNRLKLSMNGVKQQRQQQQLQFMHHQSMNLETPTKVIHHHPTPPTGGMVQQQQQQTPLPLGFKRLMINSDGNLVTARKPPVKTDSPPVVKTSSPSQPSLGSGKTTSPLSTQALTQERKTIQMRLRCRYNVLPLHSVYFENEEVSDKDIDVIFLCGDGGRVKAHKLILASRYKLLNETFNEQPAGDITTVSVPDITSDVMKLIILLAYKSNVIINSDQIDKVKDFFDVFGVDFDNLNAEVLNEEGQLDVQPGKVVENIMRNEAMRRKMVPSFTSEQLTNLQMTKKMNVPSFGNSNHDLSDEGTFKIQGYHKQPNFERRKAKLTPRVETEVEDFGEADANNLPEPDENMLKEWMAKVGKTEQEQDAKHPSSIGLKSTKKLVCKTCSATFFKESAWKWHQDRHHGHGIYKCVHCDEIRSTARNIWNHEVAVHKFEGLPMSQIEESPDPTPIAANPARSKQLAHIMRLQRLQNARIQADLRSLKKPDEVRTYKPFPQANHAIKIGHASDSSELDSKKIKQLHWLYVCARCDNCSDSAGKALLHFRKCYPSGESMFEATVTKYRQGFYGRSKCPLCPRKYVSNGGFTIHVGHQHQSYRKLFSHTGNVEDKLKCVNCNRKFGFPEEFHFHLQNGIECTQNPLNEDAAMPVLTPNKNTSTLQGEESEASPAEDDRRKKVEDAKKAEKLPAKSKSQPVIPTPTPPRSARLAKRASALLMAKVLNEQEDSDDEKVVKLPLKRRASTTVTTDHPITYPPAECPICGELVANMSQHLSVDHKDMDLSIDRISTEDLKCRRCRMTFGIPDLFGHPTICRSNTQKGNEDDSKSDVSELSTLEPSKPKREKVVHEPIEIPPGVGCSPIEEMGYTLDELQTHEVLAKAMKCPVCGKESMRMVDISNCLKQHGILRCSICFNTYSNREDYSNHMKTCHYSGSKSRCPFCPDKTFTNMGQCVGHLHSFHWGFMNKSKRGRPSSIKSINTEHQGEPSDVISQDDDVDIANKVDIEVENVETRQEENLSQENPIEVVTEEGDGEIPETPMDADSSDLSVTEDSQLASVSQIDDNDATNVDSDSKMDVENAPIETLVVARKSVVPTIPE